MPALPHHPRDVWAGHNWCRTVRGPSQTLWVSHPPWHGRALRGVQGAPCTFLWCSGPDSTSRNGLQDPWSGVRMWRDVGDGLACQASLRGIRAAVLVPLSLLAGFSGAGPRSQAIKVRGGNVIFASRCPRVQSLFPLPRRLPFSCCLSPHQRPGQGAGFLFPWQMGVGLGSR